MGLVKIKAEIGAGNDDLTEVEFMVDTGALFTILPPRLADQLGIEFPLRERVVTADNRTLVIATGMAHVKIWA